jgi:hypothetical protein
MDRSRSAAADHLVEVGEREPAPQLDPMAQGSGGRCELVRGALPAVDPHAVDEAGLGEEPVVAVAAMLQTTTPHGQPRRSAIEPRRS